MRASVRRGMRMLAPCGPVWLAPRRYRKKVEGDVFGHLVEPEQAVVEASNPGVTDVGEAGVRRDVEEDLWRILELDTQPGLVRS